MTRPTPPRIPRNHVVVTSAYLQDYAADHSLDIELDGPHGYATLRLGSLWLAALPECGGEPVAEVAVRAALGRAS